MKAYHYIKTNKDGCLTGANRKECILGYGPEINAITEWEDEPRAQGEERRKRRSKDEGGKLRKSYTYFFMPRAGPVMTSPTWDHNGAQFRNTWYSQWNIPPNGLLILITPPKIRHPTPPPPGLGVFFTCLYPMDSFKIHAVSWLVCNCTSYPVGSSLTFRNKASVYFPWHLRGWRWKNPTSTWYIQNCRPKVWVSGLLDQYLHSCSSLKRLIVPLRMPRPQNTRAKTFREISSHKIVASP